jgi:hypothetical protein
VRLRRRIGFVLGTGRTKSPAPVLFWGDVRLSSRAATRPYHASAYARPSGPFGMTSNSDLCAMGAAALPFRDSPGWWGETPSSPEPAGSSGRNRPPVCRRAEGHGSRASAPAQPGNQTRLSGLFLFIFSRLRKKQSQFALGRPECQLHWPPAPSPYFRKAPKSEKKWLTALP